VSILFARATIIDSETVIGREIATRKLTYSHKYEIPHVANQLVVDSPVLLRQDSARIVQSTIINVRNV
jgi:hypothetical protein